MGDQSHSNPFWCLTLLHRAVVVGVILFVILFANHLLPSEGFFGLLFYHCIKLAIHSKLN